MNILVVCQHYWPEQFQITSICEGLVERGHEVTVLAGLPNYPSGIIPEEYRHGRNRRQVHEGVNIIRVHEIPRKSHAVGLALNYYSYSNAGVRAIKKLPEDFDVVFSYQLSPVLMANPAVAFKRHTGTPLLLYCLDLWPESMKVLLGNRDNLLISHYRKTSKRIYDAADLIAVQSPSFCDYFKEVHGISDDRLEYLPQFADSQYLKRSFHKDHEGVNFVFLGNMGFAQNISCILEAVRCMNHKAGFSVHFVGEGSCLETSKHFVRLHGLEDRICFHGRQDYSKMPTYYEIADACLLTLDGGNWVGTTLPSKLQGYMAAGKPVIAAIDGGAREVIEASGCGACTSANNARGLAHIMDDFIDNFSEYEKCGNAGREYFEMNFTSDRFFKRLEKLLTQLVERNHDVQG